MRPVEPYQGDRFDGSWAAEWVEADGKERLQSFVHIIRDRLLAAIGDPSTEAHRKSQEYWDAKMSEPGDGDADPGSIADDANDLAISTYELLFPLRQSALNLGAVGLFHLLEQTCTSLGRAWIRGECGSVEDFVVWVQKTLGIDIKSKVFWKSLKELNSLANVIKHGEGGSASKLRKVNPRLFQYPGTYNLSGISVDMPIAAPLAGDEIFVTTEDFDRYVDAVEKFWECIHAGLVGRQWTIPKPTPVQSFWRRAAIRLRSMLGLRKALGD